MKCLHAMLDYATHPMIEKSVNFSTESMSWQKKFLSRIIYFLSGPKKDYTLNYPLLIQNTLDVLNRRGQYDLLDKEAWESMLSVPIESFDSLDNLYQNIASKVDSQILAFRWNQGLAYINNWLRNPNHYWVSVIRNPMDRALSSFKAFNQSYDDSVECTKSHAQKLEKVSKNCRHYIIYYEDLILNPEEEIRKLFEFFGQEDMEVNFSLKGQSGDPYKIETSDLISEGKKHTEGIEYKGFDVGMLNKYKSEMDEATIRKFSLVIDSFSMLERYK